MRKRGDDAADRPSAYDRAMALLARREHSRRELGRKLSEKGYPAEETAPALAALSEARAQSDERYAEVLVRQRTAAGYGPRHIEAELRSHGIAPALFRELLSGVDWLAQAQAVVERRYGDRADRGARDKAAQFLQRRGFPSDVVARLRGRPAG